MTLTEFLLARIAEDEDRASLVLVAEVDQSGAVPEIRHRAIRERVLAECEAKREIVRFHESWPVLVEGPTTFEHVDTTGRTRTDFDASSLAMRASKQMAWLTEQEYRARFGTEPPTAPMLAALAAVYADHPDFDPAWRR